MHDRIDLGNPDERNQAAADYVLGVLSPADKAQFEALMAVSHDTQREVEEWREHLDILNSSLEPVQPSKQVWRDIERAVKPESSFWQNLKFWQGASFASIAAAFLLVFMTAQQPNLANMDYVYVVKNQEHNPGWIVNASLAQNKLVMETVQPDNVPKGKACELWLMLEGMEPLSLGILPKSGSKQMTIPKEWQEKLSKARIVTTLEDMQGAPNGWNMGPVLDKGQWSSRTY
ncbi:hypothetical protein EOPP23_04075 [Endozoicomonas sp. OPT23]|nr:hypothetical protein [Endozoicomonas sp. OPT23]